ncbi:MAG: hypothetical protein ACOYJ2_01170 [Rickettsiales bacterium]
MTTHPSYPQDEPVTNVDTATINRMTAPVRISVKTEFLDRIVDHVVERLNTKNRKLAVNGKGVHGCFIEEDKIPELKDQLRESIAVMLMCNGVSVQGFEAYEIDVYDTSLKLRTALGKAYELESWGRVVRAAEKQIEKTVVEDLNAAKILPHTIEVGMYRN